MHNKYCQFIYFFLNNPYSVIAFIIIRVYVRPSSLINFWLTNFTLEPESTNSLMGNFSKITQSTNNIFCILLRFILTVRDDHRFGSKVITPQDK